MQPNRVCFQIQPPPAVQIAIATVAAAMIDFRGLASSKVSGFGVAKQDVGGFFQSASTGLGIA